MAVRSNAVEELHVGDSIALFSESGRGEQGGYIFSAESLNPKLVVQKESGPQPAKNPLFDNIQVCTFEVFVPQKYRRHREAYRKRLEFDRAKQDLETMIAMKAMQTDQPKSQQLYESQPDEMEMSTFANSRSKLAGRGDRSVIMPAHKVTNEALRYKEELVEMLKNDVLSLEAQAKQDDQDNIFEQGRQRGKPVVYGQIIQLRHTFSNAFIKASTNKTSELEYNSMSVTLDRKSDSRCYFRVMPRYKVRAVGESVRIGDHIILESTKFRGQFLHKSLLIFNDPMNLNHMCFEINLSTQASGFTLASHSSYNRSRGDQLLVKGGDVIRLFHKEVEGFLGGDGAYKTFVHGAVADGGVSGNEVFLHSPNDFHAKSKSRVAFNNALVFWQVIVSEASIQGTDISWNTRIRLRHFQSKLFLCVSDDGRVSMKKSPTATESVFLFYPMGQTSTDVTERSDLRIRHFATKLYLHASPTGSDSTGALSDRPLLRHENATYTRLLTNKEMVYKDVFAVTRVEESVIADANFIFGFLPIFNQFRDHYGSPGQIRTTSTNPVETLACRRLREPLVEALTQLEEFLVEDIGDDGVKKKSSSTNSTERLPIESRQDLMRHLGVLDVFISIMHAPFQLDIRTLDQLNAEARSSPDKLGAYKTFAQVARWAKSDYMFYENDNTLNPIAPNDPAEFKPLWDRILHVMRNCVSNNNVGSKLFISSSSRTLAVLQMLIFFLKIDFALAVIKELVDDNREVLELLIDNGSLDFFFCIQRRHLREAKADFHFLEILTVFCVCNDLAVRRGQTIIMDRLFNTIQGEAGSLQPYEHTDADSRLIYEMVFREGINEITIVLNPEAPGFSLAGTPLVDLAKGAAGVGSVGKNEDMASQIEYFTFQLKLFEALCRGRNDKAIEIVRQRYVNWQQIVWMMNQDDESQGIPDNLRAMYSRLLVVLEVDVGANYPEFDPLQPRLIYDWNTDEYPAKIPQYAHLGNHTKIPDSALKSLQCNYSITGVHCRFFVELHDFFYTKFCPYYEKIKMDTDSQDNTSRFVFVFSVLEIIRTFVSLGYYYVYSTTAIEDQAGMPAEDGHLLEGRSNWKPLKELVASIFTVFVPISEAEKKREKELTLRLKNANSRTLHVRADVKYQALRIVELLIAYQRRVTLMRYIIDFKSMYLRSKYRKTLDDELHGAQDAIVDKSAEPMPTLLLDTVKAESASRRSRNRMNTEDRYRLPRLPDPSLAAKYLLSAERGIHDYTEYLGFCSQRFQIPDIMDVLLDTAEEPNSGNLTVLALDVLRRHCDRLATLFDTATAVQVAVAPSSVAVRNAIRRNRVHMRKLVATQITPVEAQDLQHILSEFTSLCLLNGRARRNCQDIIVNGHVHTQVLSILSKQIDRDMLVGSDAMLDAFRSCLRLLRVVCQNNAGIQSKIFESLDFLLDPSSCQAPHTPELIDDLSRTVMEIFRNNTVLSLDVRRDQIQTIVLILSTFHRRRFGDSPSLAATSGRKLDSSLAAGLLDTMLAFVKVDGLPVPRNQNYVVQYFMKHEELLFLLYRDESASTNNQQARLKMLRVDKNLTSNKLPTEVEFHVKLVDLLATCVEGENRFIESICKKIYSIKSLLVVLLDQNTAMCIKRVYLRFLLTVYMSPSSARDDVALQKFVRSREMGELISRVCICSMQDYVGLMLEDLVTGPLESSPVDSDSMSPKEAMAMDLRALVQDAILPFIELYYRAYYTSLRTDSNGRRRDVTAASLPPPIELVDESGAANISSGLEEFVDEVDVALVDRILLESLQCLKNAIARIKRLSEESGMTTELAQEVKTLRACYLTLSRADLSPDTGAADSNLEHEASQSAFEAGASRSAYARDISHEEDLLKLEAMVNEELNMGVTIMAESLYNSNHEFHLCAHVNDRIQSSNEDDTDLVESSALQSVFGERLFKSKKAVGDLDCPYFPHKGFGGVEVRDTLPRGGEFQTHVHLFLDGESFDEGKPPLGQLIAPTTKIRCQVLVRQLSISLRDINDRNADDLDCKTLQLMRGILQRQRCALPLRSTTETSMGEPEWNEVRNIQVVLARNQAADVALRMLCSSRDRVIHESLLLLIALLEGGNKVVQGSVQHYMDRTHDDTFLQRIREELQNTFAKIRERRDFLNKITEEGEEMDRAQTMNTLTRHSLRGSVKDIDDMLKDDESMHSEMQEHRRKQQESERLEQIEDNTYLRSILRFLQLLCEGHHRQLQDYMRTQWENPASVNMVRETVACLHQACSVTSDFREFGLPNALQLFETLVEFCQGNQENQREVFDAQAVECVNFILTYNAFETSDELEQLSAGKLGAVKLVLSMLEDSNEAADRLAKDLMSTLDLPALYDTMNRAYYFEHFFKWFSSRDQDDLFSSGDEMSTLMHLGFNSYRVFARLEDINSAAYAVVMKNHMLINDFSLYTSGQNHPQLHVSFDGAETRAIESNTDTLGSGAKDKDGLEDESNEFGGRTRDDAVEDQMARYMAQSDKLIAEAFTHKVRPDETGIKNDASRQETRLRSFRAFLMTMKNSGQVNRWDTEYDRYIFFHLKSASIEFLSENRELQKAYFPLPSQPLPNRVQESLLWSVDRTSPTDKIRDFMKKSEGVRKDLKYTRTLEATAVGRFYDRVTQPRNWLKIVYLLLTLTINICMLVDWKGAPDMTQIRPVTSPWFDLTLIILGSIHTVLSILVGIEYYIHQQDAFSHVLFFTSRSYYHIMLVVLSVLGTIFWGYFFCIHLLHIVIGNDQMQRALMSVTKNRDTLLAVFLLGIIVVYIFSVFGFALLRGEYGANDPEWEVICDTLWHCFLTGLSQGLRNDLGLGGAIGMKTNFTWSGDGWRIIFDLGFFFLITIIWFNLILGIILDTFSQLRDERTRIMEEIRGSCFICSIPSHEFERTGVDGFRRHFRKEHNMWHYFYYMNYVSEKDGTELTFYETYLYEKMIVEKDPGVFPIKRALSLQQTAGDINDQLSSLETSIRALTARVIEKERNIEE